VIGPRREQACGCVGDVLDGMQLWVPCIDHRLQPGPDVHDERGLVQRFVTLGDLLLPVNHMRLSADGSP